jgi:hypothetical protein
LKLISRGLFLFFIVLFAGVPLVTAQNASAYFGLGTMTDSSNNQSIDTFGTGNPLNTPRLGGLFETIGGDVMVRPQLGFGAEVVLRSQSGYAGLNYRPTFYDLNAVYQPISVGMIVPEFQAGLGGANLRFYYSQAYCDAFAGCSTSNAYIESSNHFQMHLSGGVRVYVKGGIFLRPQVDVRWVNNFFQFGSDWVPQYSVAIGYTFGRH